MIREFNDFLNTFGPHVRYKICVVAYLVCMMFSLCNLIDAARSIRDEAAKTQAAATRAADELATIREAVDRLP